MLNGEHNNYSQNIVHKSFLYSLRQMEQDGINLEEESEQANAKIKKLNTQKVKLVTDFMQLIKVNTVSKKEEILIMQFYIITTFKLPMN